MKHRKGIEFGRPQRGAITYLGLVMQPAETSLGDLQEWYALGGSCPKCEREAWVDRHELKRKWGDAVLTSLAPRLRCLGCSNKVGNRWILGQLPR